MSENKSRNPTDQSVGFFYFTEMMRLLFFLSLFLCFGSSLPPGELIHRFIVLPTSQLSIHGKTNVNTFTCAIKTYAGTDTLILKEGGLLQKPVFIKGRVALLARHFDCGMKVMTTDFCETLQYKKHPAIVIQFYSFQKLPKDLNSSSPFKGTLGISLAGVSKLFEMPCRITPKSNEIIELSGERSFMFSDFNLTPPEKMMGMIKTQQELKVSFKLDLLLDTTF
ncbi:MAG: hypothetical protein ACK5OS_16615 [Chryseotalea sp.]|nr:hypothetical protein [Flammeovirgaceae bacterium]